VHIKIEYGTQVRSASGASDESLEVDEGASLADAVRLLVEQRRELLQPWFTADYRPRAGLLIFVNDQTPSSLESTRLRAGDQISLMTLISGG